MRVGDRDLQCQAARLRSRHEWYTTHDGSKSTITNPAHGRDDLSLSPTSPLRMLLQDTRYTGFLASSVKSKMMIRVRVG